MKSGSVFLSQGIFIPLALAEAQSLSELVRRLGFQSQAKAYSGKARNLVLCFSRGCRVWPRPAGNVLASGAFPFLIPLGGAGGGLKTLTFCPLTPQSNLLWDMAAHWGT